MNIQDFIDKIPFAKKACAIAYDDCGLIAISKGSGIMSHPNPNPKDNVAPAILRAKYNFKSEYFSWKVEGYDKHLHLYLVNRLDSPTSGLMLTTTNEELAIELKKAFKNHTAQKTYYAICLGRPFGKSGQWNDFLDIKRYGSFVRGKTGGGTRAITNFTFEKMDNNGLMLSLMKLEPQTGRTHQLRIQCASHKLPILGDDTYGHFATNRKIRQLTNFKRMYLHCAKTEIEFNFKGKAMKFCVEDPLPKSFKDIIEFNGEIKIKKMGRL